VLGSDLIKGAKGVEDYTGGLITQRQVYHMVEHGQLPVIRKGRVMFFRKSSLEQAFQPDAG
jgi:hypothetical protein